MRQRRACSPAQSREAGHRAQRPPTLQLHSPLMTGAVCATTRMFAAPVKAAASQGRRAARQACSSPRFGVHSGWRGPNRTAMVSATSPAVARISGESPLQDFSAGLATPPASSRAGCSGAPTRAAAGRDPCQSLLLPGYAAFTPILNPACHSQTDNQGATTRTLSLRRMARRCSPDIPQSVYIATSAP